MAGADRTEVEAQGVIKSQMLFKCIKASLTPAYIKNLTQVLPTFDQDGPLFIFYLIKEAQSHNCISDSRLNRRIEHPTVPYFPLRHRQLTRTLRFASRLTASNAEPTDLNKMMYLFQCHKTNTTNPAFLRHIKHLESDWSRGLITTPAALRENVKLYINTLKRNKQ